MILRDRVYEAIRSLHPGTSITNNELATSLGAPAPSIRRATGRLESMGRIQIRPDTNHLTNLHWQMREASTFLQDEA